MHSIKSIKYQSYKKTTNENNDCQFKNIYLYLSSYLVMPSISSQATNSLHDQYFHKPNCKSAVYIWYSTFLANIFLHKMSQKIQTPPLLFFRHFVSNFLAPRNVCAPYIKQLIILLTSQFVPSSPGAGTQYYLIVNLQTYRRLK